MRHLTAMLLLSGDIVWQYFGDQPHRRDDPGVCVQFSFSSFSGNIKLRDAMTTARDYVERNNVTWIVPGQSQFDFNLDAMRTAVAELSDLPWLKGSLRIRPDLEHEAPRRSATSTSFQSFLKFYILEEDVNRTSSPPPSAPPELASSLDRFGRDHPDSSKVAFIMMRFGTTEAHCKIADAVRATLQRHGIKALRADDKQYHDDLFSNVLTYAYGCGFGIAIFERLEAEDFNPNVSLEVGYMLALGKSVCLLKDKTLKALHTDLVGKLYRSFNPQDPTGTIPPELERWARDKGLIP